MFNDCGCDDDDTPYEPIVNLGIVTVSTSLPDSPCTPDGAVTGEGATVFADEIDPSECVDWAAPIRPGQPYLPPSEQPGTRPTKPTVFFSLGATWTGVKDDCVSGYIGLQYSYTLPAGWATSLISVADATLKATNWLNTNGPALARQNGTCEKVNKAGFFSLSFSGSSGCPSGVTSVDFGDLLGSYTSGCPVLQPAGQLKSLEFTGTSGCPDPGAMLYSLNFTGTSGCN